MQLSRVWFGNRPLRVLVVLRVAILAAVLVAVVAIVAVPVAVVAAAVVVLAALAAVKVAVAALAETGKSLRFQRASISYQA